MAEPLTQDFDPLDLGQSDSSAAKEYTQQYDVDQWYEALKEETFETAFLDLEYNEAKAIAEIYQRGKSKLSDELVEALKSLKDKVEKALAPFVSKSGGAFVRLSTRSPKDAVLQSPKLYKYLRELIGEEPNPNEDAIAWYRSIMKTMKVTSSEDALALFMGSSRSNNDITKYLQACGDDHSQFNMYIIIREYVELHPSMEFRGFAYNKKLTAVCQYYTACYFPSIVEHKKEISKRIQRFFKNIADKIPMPNFVVDIAVFEDHIKIIELNPWFCRTGAVLFNWQDDLDVLKNTAGNKRIEFRIVEGVDKRDVAGFGEIREKLRMLDEAEREQQQSNAKEDKKRGNCVIS